MNKFLSAFLSVAFVTASAFGADCRDKTYRKNHPDECKFFVGSDTIATVGGIAALGGAVIALTMSGGGDSDTSHTSAPMPTLTTHSLVGDDVDSMQLAAVRGESAYIRNDTHYEEIRLAWATARGYTGAGSKIAIMDAGPDTWHGRTVANFASGAIASNADITRYQITSTGTTILPLSQVADVYATVTDTHVTYNNSWNNTTSAASIRSRAQMIAQTDANFISQLTTAATQRDAIFVWAAGNDGASQSGALSAMPLFFNELNGHFVNVVAWDTENGRLADFSNACGITQQYCITAPGADLNTGYITASGTSFAAPLVSAAIAVLREAFPHMQANQITALLFETARDLGAPGVDAVYGHGMLDMERATRPVGTALIPIENEQMVPLQTARVAGTIGHNIKSANLQFAFFDKYGRAFTTDMNDNLEIKNPGRAFARLRGNDNIRGARIGNFEFGMRNTDLFLGDGFLQTGTADTLTFVGATNKFNIGNTELYMGTQLGFTSPKSTPNSMISSFSNVYTANISVGARHENWTFAVSIPDTIISGTMNMHLPTARATSGEIAYTDTAIDMTSRPAIEYSVGYKSFCAGFIDNPYGTDELFFMAKKTIAF